MESAEKRQFYGPYQVQFLTILEEKTPAGGEVYELHLVDQKEVKILPKRTFEVLVSDTPSTADDFQRKRMRFVTQVVLELLAEYDLELLEVEQLKNFLSWEVEERYNKITNHLWSGTPHISGYDQKNDRTLREINNALAKFPKPDEPKPEGQ